MTRIFSIFLFLILFSNNVLGQNEKSEIIYSGLDNATSIYATQDHIFVVESGKHRILKLDHNGKLIESLGGLGSGDYQFDTPIDVDATNGLKIYVSDYGNNRIQIFDRRFQYLGSITGESAFQNRRIKPTQLIVNDFRELFVYDEASKTIIKFDENGNLIDQFNLDSLIPFELKIDNEQIVLTDRTNRMTTLMSQNGLLGESFPLHTGFPEIVDFAEMETMTLLLFDGRLERAEND